MCTDKNNSLTPGDGYSDEMVQMVTVIFSKSLTKTLCCNVSLAMYKFLDKHMKFRKKCR